MVVAGPALSPAAHRPWTPAHLGRYAPGMHPDLASTLADSRSATTRWLALVEPLSSEQANWRPDPDRWSIAQVLDHLAATTGPLAPALLEAGVKARAAGRVSDGPFRYGPLSRWFLRSLAPAGARPLPAPKLYRPSASALDLAETTRRFLEAQRAFESAAESAEGLDLARVRVASPALRLFRLPLGVWCLSTAAHTLRHLAQAERVRADSRFPEDRRDRGQA